MNKKKITAAAMLGIAMSLSGTAMAAPEAGQDLEARIAAIEQQQQQLTKQLNALKKENAKLRKKATGVESNKEAISDLKKEQERVKLSGFVRAQWQNDNRNAGEPYNDENTNNRFMLNLTGDLKINPEWDGHLEIESKQHYRRHSVTNTMQHEDGTIKRVWLTGHLKNGLEITAGRRWTPLGTNFTMLGCDTNGIDVTYPINDKGLRVGAFLYAMDEYPQADFSIYGPMIKGPVGHNFDIYAAYAKLNRSKNDPINTPYEDGQERGNWIGSHAFLLGFSTNVARNLRLSADYVRTDHSYNDTPHSGNVQNFPGDTGDNNQSFVAKLDYKWTNPEVVGSFGAYLRYHYIGRNGTIWNDDNDGAMLRNSKGWTIGFKYIPWKNISWGVDYNISDAVMAPWLSGTTWPVDESYKRKMLRTQVEFFF